MLQHFTGNNPAPHEIYRTATQQFHVFAPFFYGQSRSFQSCQYYSPSGASTVTRLKSKSAIHPLLQTQINDPVLCLVLAVEGLTQVMYVLWRAAFEIFRRLIHLAAGSTHETKRLGARSRGGGARCRGWKTVQWYYILPSTKRAWTGPEFVRAKTKFVDVITRPVKIRADCDAIARGNNSPLV